MGAIKYLAALAGLAMTAFASVTASASAQEIILYDQPNYTGQSVRITSYVRNLSRVNFNDRASSARVISGTWRICQHTDMEGTCITIDEDHPTLERLANFATSVRPEGNGPGGEEHPGDESLTLYAGENYTGQFITLDSAAANLARHGFNDRARSIRYSGNRSWRLCQHANYGGACMEVRSDMPVIHGGMARQISSAEPDRTNRRGNRPRDGVWLYSGAEFRGQRVDLDQDIANLARINFNDIIGSLVIARGERWEVCEHANYRGRCEVFNGDIVSDLSQYGLRHQISSLRRIDRWDDSGGGQGGRWSAIEGGVRGVDALFFPRPEINGYGVDRCARSNGNRCDLETAERICRAAGYEHAEHYDIDRYFRVRTWHVGESRECRGRQCGAIVNVLCTNNR